MYNIEKIHKKIENFRDNRVWVTKKIRMDSEARMNHNNIISIFIVNYYTFIILALSVISLILDDKYSSSLTILTTIVSIALFGISLFISLYGFKEKALYYKQSHIDLAEIEFELDHLLMRTDIGEKILLEKFHDLKLKYNHIMEKTDNHSTYDRLNFLKQSDKLNRDSLWFTYYFKYKTPTFLFKTSIIILPILIGIVWWYVKGSEL